MEGARCSEGNVGGDGFSMLFDTLTPIKQRSVGVIGSLTPTVQWGSVMPGGGGGANFYE